MTSQGSDIEAARRKLAHLSDLDLGAAALAAGFEPGEEGADGALARLAALPDPQLAAAAEVNAWPSKGRQTGLDAVAAFRSRALYAAGLGLAVRQALAEGAVRERVAGKLAEAAGEAVRAELGAVRRDRERVLLELDAARAELAQWDAWAYRETPDRERRAPGAARARLSARIAELLALADRTEPDPGPDPAGWPDRDLGVPPVEARFGWVIAGSAEIGEWGLEPAEALELAERLRVAAVGIAPDLDPLAPLRAPRVLGSDYGLSPLQPPARVAALALERIEADRREIARQRAHADLLEAALRKRKADHEALKISHEQLYAQALKHRAEVERADAALGEGSEISRLADRLALFGSGARHSGGAAQIAAALRAGGSALDRLLGALFEAANRAGARPEAPAPDGILAVRALSAVRFLERAAEGARAEAAEAHERAARAERSYASAYARGREEAGGPARVAEAAAREAEASWKRAEADAKRAAGLAEAAGADLAMWERWAEQLAGPGPRARDRIRSQVLGLTRELELAHADRKAQAEALSARGVELEAARLDLSYRRSRISELKTELEAARSSGLASRAEVLDLRGRLAEAIRQRDAALDLGTARTDPRAAELEAEWAALGDPGLRVGIAFAPEGQTGCALRVSEADGSSPSRAARLDAGRCRRLAAHLLRAAGPEISSAAPIRLPLFALGWQLAPLAEAGGAIGAAVDRGARLAAEADARRASPSFARGPRACRHREDGDASACDHCSIFGR